MLAPLHSIDKKLLEDSQSQIYHFDQMKNVLNFPTGNFFYDEWSLKEEVKDTPLGNILSTLDFPIGEARLIILESMRCYTQHADIDDRFHINLAGDGGYLLDLDDNVIYPTYADAIWYEMDTSKVHTAISCGETSRYQLVVRKLLQNNQLNKSKTVKIRLAGSNPRYKFDNTLSSWLNYANKKGLLTNFKIEEKGCSFELEENNLIDLEYITPREFKIDIC